MCDRTALTMLGINFFLSLLLGASVFAFGLPASAPADTSSPLLLAPATRVSSVAPSVPLTAGVAAAVPEVPFFSQFRDIHAAEWQKLGCGVTSLAMIIEFYHPGVVSVDTLLEEGLASGAYLKNVGWIHRDLALLGERYGVKGKPYDLSSLEMAVAFAQFEELLTKGPVIASVYYKFDPKSPIPHLVVVNGINGDHVYYNDPAASGGGKEISVAEFKKGWKKRFIVVRP